MAENNEKIKTGIVLSGGIAKGAYQIGFCKALKKHKKFDIKAISCASIGTLNGYAFLTDKINIAEDIWKSVNIESSKKMCNSIFKMRKIYEFIDSVCEENDVITSPITTVCWSPPKIKAKYIRLDGLDYSNLKSYLKASVSVPTLMNPVYINNENLYDGAIIDNTPIEPLFSFNLDLIIVIQFDGYIPQYCVNKAMCPLLFLNLQNSSKITDSFNLGKSQVESMIYYGFNTANDILDLIESRFDSYERFLNLISYLNSGLKENPKSGDYIVKRVNRISKLLRRGETA
jgi:predicted acylesterase/phospholipase RssA